MKYINDFYERYHPPNVPETAGQVDSKPEEEIEEDYSAAFDDDYAGEKFD